MTHLDTAGAAKFVSESNDEKNAAIASGLAAKIYNLRIIKKTSRTIKIILQDF